jgi:hypothetical protein
MRARDAQLLDLRAQLGLQPLILERERGDGAACAGLLGVAGQRQIVDDRRDRRHRRAQLLAGIMLDR